MNKIYWGYDGATERLHISSEATRNLREAMERLFGRAVLYGEGDVIGEYEHVTDPAAIFVHSYYGVKPPTKLIDYLHEHYPGAEIRQGKQQPHQARMTASPALVRSMQQISSADWARENLVVPPSDTWDRFGSLSVRLAKADMQGAMVALYPPEDVATKLAVEGGEDPDRLHITLIYFKDKAADRDDWHKVERAVGKTCKDHPVLEGTIGGYGVFENPEEGKILWAHPDVPELTELRHRLVEAVEKDGFEISRTHGFSPHLTLKYGHEGDLPSLEQPLPVHFDAVYLVRGDSKGEGSKLATED